MSFLNESSDRDSCIKNFWQIMFAPKYDGKGEDIKKADAILRLSEDIVRKSTELEFVPLSVMSVPEQIEYYQKRILAASENWHIAKETRNQKLKNLSELYCKYYNNKIEFLKSSMQEWKKPEYIMERVKSLSGKK